MKQPYITLNDITKIYNGQYVIKNTSYTFYNDLYVINGINGSGKSTLVKLITKIINPSSGKIKTNKKICYLSEKFELPRSMTSFQIINLYLKDKEKTIEFLTKWEIPNKKLNSLSKGNFQKLGIVLMIIQNADIYIFDEPTDSLDVDIINIFYKCIKLLKDSNKCILIILHQLNLDHLNPIKLIIKDGVLCEN